MFNKISGDTAVNRHEIFLFSGGIDTVLDIINAIFGTDFEVPLYERAYRLLLKFIFGDDADAVLEHYPPLPDNQNNYDQFAHIYNDYAFICPSRQVSIIPLLPHFDKLYTHEN
jgi:hypothetical protein